MPWWVLNVFVDLIESEEFTQAKIFTIFSDREYLTTTKWKLEVVTALPKRLNKIFLSFSKKNNILSSVLDYRNLIFFYRGLMKILSKKIIKYTPPKVIISSFAIAKNLEFCRSDYISTFNPITSLYLHSPMQYIRSHNAEYNQKLTGYKLKIFKYITPILQKRDQQYTKFDQVCSNSQSTAKLAQKIYNIQSKIKYPKLEKEFLNTAVKTNISPQNYYIYVGRLVKFVKELDKIIKLFNENSQPLLIMWTGPDKEYLQSIAKGNIIFIWRIQDPNEKLKLIQNSLWLINITKESFWLWTVEWLLLWVPVFAYNDWASPELVDTTSGILVPDKNHKTLVKYFDKFENTIRNRDAIQTNIKNKLKKYPRS